MLHLLFDSASSRFVKKNFAGYLIIHTFALPKRAHLLRYGVMVAQEILALLVRVRVLVSQLNDGAVAQLVRAHDS